MILTKDGDLIFPLPGDGAAAAAFIVLKKPAECPRCHRAAAFVVNRGGKTLCSSCDDPEAAP